MTYHSEKKRIVDIQICSPAEKRQVTNQHQVADKQETDAATVIPPDETQSVDKQN